MRRNKNLRKEVSVLLDLFFRQANEISKLQRDLNEITEQLELASENFVRSLKVITPCRTIVIGQKARLAA